ncbi:MAG: DEAD/DEAH box helicase [Nitrospinae bacterium]|nr:DEAD/DEAH box helicase [Nitrospinota bacterium]
MKFESLNLDPKLFNAITDMGYERCTPVQEQALPESLAGNDIAVQAQTGTGKTAVFLVTALQRMIAANDEGGSLRAIVLVPTRELAVQVEQQAVDLCKYLHYRSIAIYGGVGYDEQERALSSGAEIIVATPGRLIDFIKSGKVKLGSLGFFIIDEADRMFDMGFMEDVKYILKFAPPKEKRQTIIVSATLDDRIRHLAYQYMREATEIEIEPDQITVDKVEQRLFHVSMEEKFPVLLTLLKREQFQRVIIFVNMKRTAEELGFRLSGNGIEAEVLTGDIDQKKRLRIIDKMKEGKVGILVATDVAARGLHIDEVSHVINFDLPADAANYVHRIGRTARAGASGVAYTLACEDLVANLPPIERYIDMKIKVETIDFELEKDASGPYRRGRRPRPGEGGGGRAGGGKRSDFQRKSKPFAGGGPRRPESGDRDRDRGRDHDRPKPPSHAKGHKPRRPEHGEVRGSSPKPSKQMSQEDRMELYRRKYGDSFGGKGAAHGDGHHAKPHAHPVKTAHGAHKPAAGHKGHKHPESKHEAPKEKKRGILTKIFGVFKSKKS